MQNIVQIDLVFPKLKIAGRKKLLGFLAAEIAAAQACSPPALQEKLLENDREETTGVGEGIAIPHLRLLGFPRRFTALATLDKPLDFRTPDDAPVDLVCILISPEADGPLHLRRLARLSRMLKNRELAEKLREAQDEDAVRALLTGPEGWLMAA